MTSPYLTQPLRTELQARIERAARKMMEKYPATTWFAKNERTEKDIRFLAWVTQSELEQEKKEPRTCNACEERDAVWGGRLCEPCLTEHCEERNAELDRAYRGPRYWRSL